MLMSKRESFTAIAKAQAKGRAGAKKKRVPLLWTPPDIARDKPGKLELVCRKCTREGVWYSKEMTEAARMAMAGGWTATPDSQAFICPRCPK